MYEGDTRQLTELLKNRDQGGWRKERIIEGFILIIVQFMYV
jgi:hypothetical protein